MPKYLLLSAVLLSDNPPVDFVDSVLNAEINTFLRYYDIARRNDPNLSGVLAFKLHVGSGAVRRVEVLAETIYSPKLVKRVSRRLKHLNFGALDSSFTYQIYFK